MIFVTVGAQMAFDRLVRAVDEWSGRTAAGDVYAQIGPSDFRPRHIRWTQFLKPPEFRAAVEEAQVVVAHAGMGSILTALELGKPIIVMPRRGDLLETRNDHQLATARRLVEQGRIEVALDERELGSRLAAATSLRAGPRISNRASPQLLETIRLFLGDVRGAASRVRTPGEDGLARVGKGLPFQAPQAEPAGLTAGARSEST